MNCKKLLSVIWLVIFLFIACFEQIPARCRLLQNVKQDSVDQLILRYQKQLSQSPQNTTIMNKIAKLFLQKTRSDSADIYLELSLNLNKSDPETYFLKGRSYLQKRKIWLKPLAQLFKIIKQDHHSKAIRSFKKAIQIDSNYLEAYYYLGKAYYGKGGESNYRDALSCYDHILAQNENFMDSRYQLGLSYFKLQMYDEAENIFNTYVNNNPEDGRPLLELSRLYFDTGQPEAACRCYMDGIVKLRDPEMFDLLFLEIKDIVTDEEKTEYEKSTLAQKGYFFKKFWKNKDPTPLADLNERLAEQNRRLKYARDMFRTVIPPYYDDRGRIYVKYGEPDTRFIFTLNDQKRINAKPNESWSYEESIRRGLVFDFMDLGGGIYIEIQDLSEAGKAKPLYLDRALELGGSYAVFSNFDDMTLLRIRADKTEAIADAPVEVYHHDYIKEDLPFRFRQAQFRRNQIITDLEIYYSVNLKDLPFKKVNENNYTSTFTSTFAVFDSLFNEVDKTSHDIDIKVNSSQKIEELDNIDLFNIKLNPSDQYHFVFQIEDKFGEKLGIKKWQGSIRQFYYDSLQISDIELVTKIEKTAERDQFYKNGLQIVPYADYQFEIDKPLIIYYEIYNLYKNQEHRTKYQIDYKITSIKPKANIFSKLLKLPVRIFRRGGTSSISSSYIREGKLKDEREYISFDVKKLPAGIAKIEVMVKDLYTNQNKVSALQIKFIK